MKANENYDYNAFEIRVLCYKTNINGKLWWEDINEIEKHLIRKHVRMKGPSSYFIFVISNIHSFWGLKILHPKLCKSTN